MKRLVLRRFYKMASARSVDVPAYNPDKDDARLTGVACPFCYEELITGQVVVPYTHPARMFVRCPKCGFKGGILKYAV